MLLLLYSGDIGKLRDLYFPWTFANIAVRSGTALPIQVPCGAGLPQTGSRQSPLSEMRNSTVSHATMQTEICITIDTEFSIAGAFADPSRYCPVGEPNVTCPTDGRENGLGFLLDVFAQYGIAATFFVESLQTAYFGDVPMGRITERILRAGHDVQLHIHPCWLTFRDPDWGAKLTGKPPNDSCSGRAVGEIQDLISEGIARFLRLGAPSPIALRTGGLHVDRAVYDAMSVCGLHLASNIGLGVFVPNDPALRLAGGRHWVGDVLEVPVLTYRQLPGSSSRIQRPFAVTATSWWETEALLRQARAAAVETIVILTHPFEYVKGKDLDASRRQVNRINQRRLQRLCEFVARNPREFVSVSFRQAAERWLSSAAQPAPCLRMPLHLVLHRYAENVANDCLAWL